MKFVRLSNSNIVNLESIVRLEIYHTDLVTYATITFMTGESYRCTEEESAILIAEVIKSVEG